MGSFGETTEEHFAMMEGRSYSRLCFAASGFEINPTRTIVEDDFTTPRPKGGVPAIVRARA